MLLPIGPIHDVELAKYFDRPAFDRCPRCGDPVFVFPTASGRLGGAGFVHHCCVDGFFGWVFGALVETREQVWCDAGPDC